MKKLVLFAVAVFTLSLVSCGGSKKVDPEVEAKRIADSVAAAAEAEAAKLQEQLVVDSVQLSAAQDSIAAETKN